MHPHWMPDDFFVKCLFQKNVDFLDVSVLPFLQHITTLFMVAVSVRTFCLQGNEHCRALPLACTRAMHNLSEKRGILSRPGRITRLVGEKTKLPNKNSKSTLMVSRCMYICLAGRSNGTAVNSPICRQLHLHAPKANSRGRQQKVKMSVGVPGKDIERRNSDRVLLLTWGPEQDPVPCFSFQQIVPLQ